MSAPFESVEEMFLRLSDPTHTSWPDAFRFLYTHPETAGPMMHAFRDTLSQLGVEPSGKDPATGESIYSLSDVAQVFGVPMDDLGAAIRESGCGDC